uniref:proteasome endopeptidase complex n=1 Tax=Acanthochromis polyacanthus TaxID=80966 RepID=A0A3Q1H782_9TELE
MGKCDVSCKALWIKVSVCIVVLFREYVSSKTINKVIQVHDRIFCCIAGSLADAQAVTKAAKFHLSFHSVQMESPPLVIAAASVNISYKYKEELSAHLIVAGWDRRDGGQVFATLNGLLTRQPFAIGGSGSSYVYGFVDAEYRKGMTKEECQQFVVNTLALAMNRDGSSGGVAYMVTIDEHSTEEKVILGNDLPTFFDQ